MSQKNANELAEMRGRPVSELRMLLKEQIEALRKLRLRHATTRITDIHRLGAGRRRVAQLNTILTQATAAGRGGV